MLRSMSDSSLSSNDDSPVVFQGFSLYSTAEDEDCAYDGDDAAPAAPCEVRPDSTRSFNDRVEELLRRRVAECAASSPVTKRRRLFGHLVRPPPRSARWRATAPGSPTRARRPPTRRGAA